MSEKRKGRQFDHDKKNREESGRRTKGPPPKPEIASSHGHDLERDFTSDVVARFTPVSEDGEPRPPLAGMTLRRSWSDVNKGQSAAQEVQAEIDARRERPPVFERGEFTLDLGYPSNAGRLLQKLTDFLKPHCDGAEAALAFETLRPVMEHLPAEGTHRVELGAGARLELSTAKRGGNTHQMVIILPEAMWEKIKETQMGADGPKL